LEEDDEMHIEAGATLVGAVLIDRILGEPPDRVHPTVYMGKVVSMLKPLMPCNALGGVLLLLIVTLVFSLPAYLMITSLSWISLKVAVAAILLKTTFSWRALSEYTLPVKRALESGDIEGARELLPYIVSRDPSQLNYEEISSAAVESIAENSIDAVAAPLLYFTIFSFFDLELGVAAAVLYRAVNTLDAMVGYPKYASFGMPSAKLDDLLNFPVARLFIPFLLLSTCLTRASLRGALESFLRDRKKPTSPNAGIAMSIMAGALRVRLKKPGHYTIGDFHSSASTKEIERALMIVDVASLLYIIILLFALLYF
jgi:adenosylcobinamide-phosphate synthase